MVRQGSIADLYEKMGGKVFYIGKPYEIGYRVALQHFQRRNILNLAEILMVGDTPETDIRGAKAFGLSSALVTQTGIMAEKIAAQGLEKTLQNLPASDLPEFFIGTFSQ